MRNPEQKLAGVFYFRCKRLNCSACSKIKKDQYKATVQYHLGHLIKTSPNPDKSVPVYLFHCEAGKQWARLSAQIRTRRDFNGSRGRYFRIECGGSSGFYLVCSTVPVSNVTDGDTPNTITDALSRLCSTIDAIPLVDHKPFTSSREWPVLKDTNHGQWFGWVREGAIDPSNDVICSANVLHQQGIEPRITRSRHHWWSYRAVIFSIAGVDWDKVSGDLMAGEVLPYCKKLGWSREAWEGSDGDDWDGRGGGTGPPIPTTPSAAVFPLQV
jgi:hypothetical protein